MGKIAGFLFGLLIGLAIFGVGALLYFPHEARIENTSLELPSITKVGFYRGALVGKAVPEVTFEGNIELSPEVAGTIKSASRVIATVEISQFVPDIGKVFVGRMMIDNPKFPLHYSMPWARFAIVSHLEKESLGVYDVDVMICTGQSPGQCYPLTLPRYGGSSRATPMLKGTLASQPIGAKVELDAGSTVVNFHRSKTDIAACVNSGYTISGTIKATASFLAKAGNNPRVAILAHPLKNIGMSEPFASSRTNKLPPVTRADMSSAGASGIAFTNVTLAGAAGAPFTLKLPEEHELMMYSFVAVLCKPGEDDLDCAARFYPAVWSYSLSYGDAGIYRLSPKDFHIPSCGDKTVFYLNDWKQPPGSAGMEAYLKANPPEVVDGATF